MNADMMQAHRAPWKRLSPPAKWRRAVAAVERSGLLPVVEHNLHATTGRPRKFTARALLTGLMLHSINGNRTMVLTEVADSMFELSPSQRHELGMNSEITYNMIWGAFDKISSLVDADGLAVPGSETRLEAEVFADRIIAASVPGTYTPSTSIAIDGTDLETWARRRSWGNKASLPKAGTEIPTGTVNGPDKPKNEQGWPKIGADGRPQHSPDPDARDGYRSGHNGRPSDFYSGYELHLATQIPTIGADPVPHIVVGLTVTPGGTHRGPAGVRTIDGMRNVGQPVTEVCADRGYTFCVPASFVQPMWLRGIDVWADFHPKQRGQHPGTLDGTIWIDGSLFVAALPEVMRNLAPPGQFASATEVAECEAAFDRRKAYAFTALSKRDKAGYQRMKGPALAGHVRCPNVPKSMRLTYDHPTTNCVKGDPCACGRTVTISPDESPRERQTHAWGTSAWSRAYHRRSAIESTNAELKSHRLDLSRGFTRVFGTVRNTLLLAFAIAGMNIRIFRDWHAKRFLPDPWAVALHEADLGDGGGSREAATRARRRTRTYADLGVAPPDDPATATGGTRTEVTA